MTKIELANKICKEVKKSNDKYLPFEPTDRDMIHEEDVYGNDCKNGTCE